MTAHYLYEAREVLHLMALEKAYAVVWIRGFGVICTLDPATKVRSCREHVTAELMNDLEEQGLIAVTLERPTGSSYSITNAGRKSITKE